MLLIKEKRGFGNLKPPGGLVDPGERLDEAVIREVFEETGVECTFDGLLGVRETTLSIGGRSDLYFIALCSAKTAKIRLDEVEIATCDWFPIDFELLKIRNEAFRIVERLLDPNSSVSIRDQLM